jgi:hypothetical protein
VEPEGPFQAGQIMFVVRRQSDAAGGEQDENEQQLGP